MEIGVKFCGGCNPKYDRSNFLRKIKERTSFEFQNAKEDVEYDILLVLGGCKSCCADYKQLKYKQAIIVTEQSDYEEALKIFERVKKED